MGIIKDKIDCAGWFAQLYNYECQVLRLAHWRGVFLQHHFRSWSENNRDSAHVGIIGLLR